MLVPSHDDPNRESELKRMKLEPDTFGVTKIEKKDNKEDKKNTKK